MRLSVSVVGILPENDDLCLGKRRIMQRIKDRKHVGIDAPCAVLSDKKLPQLPIVGLRHLIRKQFLPVIVKNFLRHA